MRLRFGEEISGFSTMLRAGYEDVRLHLGRANRHNDDRNVASFEMHNISVQVTDQVAVGSIIEMWQTKSGEQLRKYLEEILFECLKKDPQQILDMMLEEYERGVSDGRKEKAEEIRAVIMCD